MHFVFTAPRYHTNQHFAAKALVDAGHRVSFLVLEKGQSETYEAVHPEVLGESVASRTFRRMLSGFLGRTVDREYAFPPVLALWRRLRRLAPDIVIVRGHRAWYGRLSIWAARLNGFPIVFYTQNRLHRPIDRFRRFLHTFRARIAGAQWITPVLGDPDRYPPAVPLMRYVPFVMEPQTPPDRKTWFSDDAVNILSIGKFQRRKNHHLLLRAVAHLSTRYPLRATVIGECTTAEHRRELAELKRIRDAEDLSDRVRIRSDLPYQEVQRELSVHDVFVLASRTEPATVSQLEAMAHSLSIICSDANGTKCYVRPGENGYIVRTDDADDLERKLETVVRDRDRLMRMGARSHALVVSEHAPHKYVRTMLALVESARGRRTATAASPSRDGPAQ